MTKPGPFLIDVFEPAEVEAIISQSLEVTRLPLNSMGFADYRWNACDMHTVQVERKQISEILSDLDACEAQLRKWILTGDENLLLWEGEFKPSPKAANMCQVFKTMKNGVLVPAHDYRASYTQVQNWFNQLDKCGITIVHTFDTPATAIVLVGLYNSSQNPEHRTFKRYLKHKVTPAIPNPQVEILMNMGQGMGIGEVRAKALIRKFGTTWNVVNQSLMSLATVDGVGLGTAKRFFEGIGKPIK